MKMSSSSENLEYSSLLGSSESEISVYEYASGSNLLINKNYRPQPNPNHTVKQVKPTVLAMPRPPTPKPYNERFNRTGNAKHSMPSHPRQIARYNSSTHSFKTLYFPLKESGAPKSTKIPKPPDNLRNCLTNCLVETKMDSGAGTSPPIIEVFRKKKSEYEAPSQNQSIYGNKLLRTNTFVSKNVRSYKNQRTKSPKQKFIPGMIDKKMNSTAKEIVERKQFIQSRENKRRRRRLLGSAISREEFPFVNRIKYDPNYQSGTIFTEEDFKSKASKLTKNFQESRQPEIEPDSSGRVIVPTALRSFGTDAEMESLKPKTGNINFTARSRTISRESRHKIHEVEPSTDLFFRYSKSIPEQTKSQTKFSLGTDNQQYKARQKGMRSRYMKDLEWRIGQAINIYVYRNGVENLSPQLIHIPPNKRRNMATLLEVLQERIKYPVGYANALYTMDGVRIKHPSQLENNNYNTYVVASNFDKHFKCIQYGRKRSPLLIFSKESRNARVLKKQDLSLAKSGKDVYHDDDDLKYLFNDQGNYPINFKTPMDNLNFGDEHNFSPAPISYKIRDIDGVEGSATALYTAPRNYHPSMNIRRSRLQDEFRNYLNSTNNNLITLPSTLSSESMPYYYKMNIYRNYIADNIIPPPTGFRD